MALGLSACRHELKKDELPPEERRFLFVEDRYKRLKKGMTLSDAADVLGKSPSDSLTKDIYIWLYRDTVIETELDGERRIKEMIFKTPPEWLSRSR